ncbi:MAG TPA: pyridoxal phosphate-dependent aminotransferase family protein [Actinomycetota bacterium]|nr:pyridoxal phosphate-dependent aminotransferase family protein [Actinomycetota bacterium]
MSKPEQIDSADDGRPRNDPARRRASDILVPRPLAGKPQRRESDGWLERWMATVEDLARLKASHPMLDAVIDEQDGRRIRIGDHWLADFASCNYLGLDLDPEVIDAVPEYLARWGTHPSWSRLLGSPVLYEQLEETTTALLGSEDSLLLPTITHIHMSVIPVLVGSGVIFLDERAHKTMYDGASVARGHGATIQRFRHNDAEHLEQVVRASRTTPRMIAVDGVNSMTGNAPDIKEFARIAREHDALLYVDDAHGFGVIGERSPDELCEWGVRGNGVVRHQGETYDNVVLVSGFSKAYSSLLSFLALPTRLKDVLKVAAPPYLYSGPSPVASLATAIAGLAVNDARGDLYRAQIYRKTRRVVERLHELDIYTPNESGFPLIEIPLAHRDDIDVVGRYLFDRGVYVTMAAYPLVPKEETGFRIQITAANPDDQIDLLCEVLGEISERFELQHEQHRSLMLRAREARR